MAGTALFKFNKRSADIHLGSAQQQDGEKDAQKESEQGLRERERVITKVIKRLADFLLPRCRVHTDRPGCCYVGGGLWCSIKIQVEKRQPEEIILAAQAFSRK